MRIFELFGDVLINDRATPTINNIGTSVNKLGSNLTSGIATVAKWGAGLTAAAGAAFTAFSAKAIQTGADAEEMLNKYNVVFAGMTEEVDSWSNAFADRVGRSKFQTQEFLSNISDLTQGFGMSKEASFDLSKQIVELGTDLASFSNTSDATAIEAVTKAMMGEAEMAKQLGLALNVNQVKEYAESQGLVYEELSKAEKMQITYNLAVQQSQNAIGDAERSAGSYTNRMKALKDTLSDVTKEFGMKLLPAATNFVNLLLDKGVPAFEKFLKVISDNWNSVKQTVTTNIANVIRAIADLLRGFDAFLKSNNTILDSIKSKFISVFGDVKEIISGVWTFIKKIWEENGDQVGRIILKIFNLWITSIKFQVGLIKKIFESELGTKFVNFLKKQFKNVLDQIEDIVDLITALLQGDFKTALEEVKNIMVRILTQAFNMWKFIVTSQVKIVFTIFKKVLKFQIGLIKKVFDTEFGNVFKETIRTSFQSIFNVIEGIIKTFVSVFKGDFISAKESVIAIFEDIKLGLSTNINRWWSFLKPAVSNFVADVRMAIADLSIKAFEVGEDIIKGLTEGIKAQTEKAKEAITGVGKGIYKSITGFFDIHSPSRVMHQIGGFIVYGLANGIEDNSKTAIGKTADMLDEIADKIEGKGIVQSAADAGKAIAKAFGEGTSKGFKEVGKQTKKFLEDNKENLGKIKNTMDSVASQIGGKFAHSWEVAQGVGQGAMQALSGDWFGLANTVVSNAPRIAKSIAGIFGGVSKGHKVTADAAIAAWNNAYNKITGASKQFVQDFGNVFIGSIQSTISAFERESRSGLSKWLFGSKKSLDEYARTAVSMMTYISQETAAKFIEIDKTATSTFDKLAGTATTALQAARDTIRLTFSNLQGTLTGDLRKINKKMAETGGNIEAAFQKAENKSREVWNKVVRDVDKAVREIEPLLQQLRGEAVSDAEKLGQATIRALEKKYEEEKQLEEKRINESLALSEEQKENELRILEDSFNEKMKTENLRWEAIVLGEKQNQEELINLLYTYEPRWEQAGMSIGEALVRGMQAVAGVDPTSAVLKTLEQIKEVRNLEQELKDVQQKIETPQQLTRQVVPGETEETKTNAGIQQTINVYAPQQLDPIETARQVKNASQQLALGI